MTGHDTVLIVLPEENNIQKRTMLLVAKLLATEGHQVAVIPAAEELSLMVDTWRYPSNWPAISRRIRARDGWRCRWCGVGNTLFDPTTLRPIRLTAMHLDRDPSNNEDWNLVCACRPCHVAYDAPDFATARAEARLRALLNAGRVELFPALP